MQGKITSHSLQSTVSVHPSLQCLLSRTNMLRLQETLQKVRSVQVRVHADAPASLRDFWCTRILLRYIGPACIATITMSGPAVQYHRS